MRKRALLQERPQIVVAHREPEAISLMLQHGALHLLLADARLEKRLGILRIMLLLDLLLRNTIHIGSLHFSRIAGEPAEEPGSANLRINRSVVDGIAIIKNTGNQSDDHCDDGCSDNERKDGFGEPVVLLQNADHAWLTTFTSREASSGLSRARDFCARLALRLTLRRTTPACRGSPKSINQPRPSASLQNGFPATFGHKENRRSLPRRPFSTSFLLTFLVHSSSRKPGCSTDDGKQAEAEEEVPPHTKAAPSPAATPSSPWLAAPG